MSDLLTEYVTVVFDVGELKARHISIVDAASSAVRAWGEDAVLEVRRADYRDRFGEVR